MYIPNEWYNEFEEYKKEEFYENEGIYDNFSDQQIRAIKEYFRWRTKIRFKELVANTKLEAKPKKAETLAKIMGGITDWVYDGCVDTGEFGGGNCELGHALRYEHYAFSPSTTREIVFGVTCASDFFGIEPEKLRKINKVQAEILEEVKFIAYIRNTGKHRDYIKRFYPDLMDVINTLRNEMNEAFGKGWNEQMANFLTASLPWTQSMVGKFQYVHRTTYQKRVDERSQAQKVLNLCNNDPKAVEFLQKGAASKDIFLVKIIINHLANNKDATGNELKKLQAMLRLSILFDDTYTKLSKYGVADFKKFVNSAKENIYYVNAANGERLATKGEIENKVAQLIIKEEMYLPENQFKMLRLFGWGVFGDERMYKDSGCDSGDNDIDKIFKSGRIMSETLEWLNKVDELKITMLALKEHMDSINYPESAIDEIKPELSIKEIIDYIYDQDLKGDKNRLYDIAGDIADRAVQNNNYNISVKQSKIVRDAYAQLTGKATPNNQNNQACTEVDDKIALLIQNKNHPSLTNHDFAFKIIGTVKKYGKVSINQKKYIEEAYDALILALEKGQSAKANIIFIEDNDSKKSGAETKQIQNNNSVFVEGSKNSKPMDNWNTEANSIVSMPSISEISQALGQGVLKEDEHINDE